MTEQLTKKEWIEPELIVLVRNKPEEAVLTTCKGSGIQGGGHPTATFDYCVWNPGVCAECTSLGAS